MTKSLCVVAVVLAAGAWPAAARSLTFDERVRAQEAIERVAYAHQIGATQKFEDAVPRGVIEGKVRAYLEQSAALDQVWHTPVTAEALKKEWARIHAQTQLPDRLREIEAALGNDPFLIQECLARATLVDRLSRDFFAGDTSIHTAARKEANELRFRLATGALSLFAADHHRETYDVVRSGASRGPGDSAAVELGGAEFDRLTARSGVGPVEDESDAFVITVVLKGGANRATLARYRVDKKTWDDWWEGTRRDLHSYGVPAVADPSARIDAAASSPVSPGTFTPSCTEQWTQYLPLPGLPEAQSGHRAVWTGSLMLIWGDSTIAPRGGRYDPATDTWSPISTTNAPPLVGGGESAVWCGSEMIVWGGDVSNVGARYNPATDVWTPTSTIGAPSGRGSHTAIWTGTEMIVWGGDASGSPLDTGARYDPATDSWTPTSMTGAPNARTGHTAVWTGTQMIVWGGSATDNTGGRYDPVADTWTPTSVLGVNARLGHTAVWTGSLMIVFGGTPFGGGFRYDPAADHWQSISAIGAPTSQLGHTAVWSGTQMIVWGGSYDNTGGRYDPVANTWTPTNTNGAPAPRTGHSAIWTGTQMVVWGGEDSNAYVDTGGRYDPTADSWTATQTRTDPIGRWHHTAVWTGSQMIVWGGMRGNPGSWTGLNTGGKYDPATASWSPTSTTSAPSARGDHTAVWTGSLMIVWGGENSALLVTNTGGRYDPVANSWTATSLTNAPLARGGTGFGASHTAVWTGTFMIVWGGDNGSGTPTNTGSRYVPSSNAWLPTTTTGAPQARFYHSALWTGTRMIVWGGSIDNTPTLINTGGVYNPSTDSWTSTSVTNAPTGRGAHTAVWTGSSMIVFGGGDPSASGAVYGDGGRYNPTNNTWTPIASGSPSIYHRSFWTGNLMVVWGGAFDTGGGARYEPVHDLWSPITTTNAPPGLALFGAVWTGSSMLIWGGSMERGPWTYAFGPTTDADGDGYLACGGDCDDTHASVYPGAPQVCGDALNNNCSDPNWPSLTGTGDMDADGDGVAVCQGDCDDTQPQAWATPGEVASLRFTDKQTIVWSPPASPGGTSVLYDTLRTPDANDFNGGAVCLDTDDSATTASDATTPSIGQILFYLARAQNSCPGAAGQGSIGTKAGGVERAGRSCP